MALETQVLLMEFWIIVLIIIAIVGQYLINYFERRDKNICYMCQDWINNTEVNNAKKK